MQEIRSLRRAVLVAAIGAPCPGAARSDAYRLGWEVGAIRARRVAVSPWLLIVIAQTDAEHLRAIGLPNLH
jgi:hypothetical protein